MDSEFRNPSIEFSIEAPGLLKYVQLNLGIKDCFSIFSIFSQLLIQPLKSLDYRVRKEEPVMYGALAE